MPQATVNEAYGQNTKLFLRGSYGSNVGARAKCWASGTVPMDRGRGLPFDFIGYGEFED